MEIVVKEFGFSRAVEILCPTGWKDPLGENWQEVLDFIILRESPESYIAERRKVPESLDPHIQLGAQKSALQRRMKKEHGVELKDLWLLLTVYIVSLAGKKFISKMTDEQKEFLEKLGLELEVD